jgi:hypothetical protein
VSAHGPISFRWRADPSPPEPEGAVAWKEAARRLHARLGRLPPEVCSRLWVSAGRDFLVVTGAVADLPWVCGIAYAARCATAQALWRPTLHEPDVPPDLLARALFRLHAREPLLLWPLPAAVVPLDRLLPVTQGLLERIASRWQAS